MISKIIIIFLTAALFSFSCADVKRDNPEDYVNCGELTVSIISPEDKTIFESVDNTTIQARVISTKGKVTSVEVFADETKLGNAVYTGADNIYEYEWTDIPPASYTLTVRAFDSKENSAVSAAISARFKAWQVVGTPGFSDGTIQFYTTLAVDKDGMPYVQYRDDCAGGCATVKKYNGSTWTNVGNPGFSLGVAYWPSLKFDNDDILYLSLEDAGIGFKAAVYQFSNNGWDTLGTPGFSDGIVSFTRLAFDSNNIPYIAFKDEYNNINKPSVLKYTGNGTSGWEYLGSPRFTSGEMNIGLDLLVDKNGIPYIAFDDGSLDNKTSIMKFNGTSWEYLGPGGFSLSWTGQHKILVDSKNTIYCAYVEIAPFQIVVRKYNDLSWDYVGGRYIIYEKKYLLGFEIDSKDNLYVLTSDKTSYAIEIFRFNNSSWIPSGSLGTTSTTNTDVRLASSIAIDKNDNIYVSFIDGRDAYKDKPTVMVYR